MPGYLYLNFLSCPTICYPTLTKLEIKQMSRWDTQTINIYGNKKNLSKASSLLQSETDRSPATEWVTWMTEGYPLSGDDAFV
jgi:hypothetical protein